MYRFSAPWRPLLSFMASAKPHRWCSSMDLRFLHGSRNMASSSGVSSSGKEELGKPDISRSSIPTSNTVISLGEHSQHMNKNSGYGRPSSGENNGRRTSVDVSYGDEEACTASVEVTVRCSDDEENVSWAAEIPRYSVDRVVPLNILPDSSHRDGSIYRGTDNLKKDYRIVDRSETRLEAMMLSDPTDCTMRGGTCMRHLPQSILQIFSLKLAKIPVDAVSVELYGYLAARDQLEPLLNYVVNVSRDDPIAVEKGSVINMAPKRWIGLGGTTLIEYDMKIKTGGHEKDDLQLIDGISVLSRVYTWDCSVFTCRIIGDCGAIDISASRLDHAVEATVEVAISEVQCSFNMRLGCFIGELDEETL